MSVQAHRATTAHVQALYPWMAEAGLGSRGVPIGPDVFGRRTFCFDPFEQYQRTITNLNVSISGAVGKRKSSLVKTFLARWLIGAGRQAVVMDVKPEYYQLAQALGVESIQLGGTSGVTLNPLDPRVSGDRQLELLEAIVGSRLRRVLSEAERMAIQMAHATAISTRGPAVLSEVMRAMLTPDPARLSGVGFSTVESFVEQTRDAALAMRGVCEGRLRSSIDGPTSPSLDLSGKMLHFDLSSERDSGDIGVLMCCAAAFLQGALSVNDGIKRVLVLDEAWRLLEDPRTTRWLRGSAKLSRQGAGLSHWFVMHRFGDYGASGEAGSQQQAHAQGLLSDTETRIIYALSAHDAKVVQETLGLTNCQTEILTTMPPGTALWRVGERSFLVRHQLASEAERLIVENGLAVA